MNRKIRYGFRIIYNFFRVFLLKMITLGKFRSSFILLASHKSEFRLEYNGTIEIKRSLNMEANSLLYACGGHIKVEGAFINRNCTIVSMDSIAIGEKVTIGPGVCIYDHDHNISNASSEKPYVSEEIVIEDGVWIGAQAVILKGVHIGSNAVVAAGTVVTKDIPAGCIGYGVPVKYKELK